TATAASARITAGTRAAIGRASSRRWAAEDEQVVEDKLRQAAFSAFTVLMRPLARILLRCGVTWKELAELLKAVYVDVATQDYGKRGRPANSSRVAILTGLSRREVKRARDRLAGAPPDSLAPIAKINHASRVLSGWFQDPAFVDAKGNP